MKVFIYTSNGTKLRNVYRDDGRLVVRREVAFPDICSGCGRPAWGNVMQKEFSGLTLAVDTPPDSAPPRAYSGLPATSGVTLPISS